jgi:glucose/arabinose dehydrogenase
MRYFRRPSLRAAAALFALSALSTARPAVAAVVDPQFFERAIVNALASATAMAFSPDGRLFVAQQTGALRVIRNGRLLPTPFVTLTVSSVGERGLLGVAFDPDFATNQWVYVYYTATSPTIHNRISRFTAQGDVAAPGSEVVLMDLETLSATNHNGGAIHFGPDGKLYVAVGENAVGSNSQNLANRLGKILRINKDGTVPLDNPFHDGAGSNADSIWALGLRNPFTFAFNPEGRMFVNDVGQSSWEEINDGIAGSNYGWPTVEGPSTDPRFRAPLYAYPHTPSCDAIVGGAFHDSSKVRWPADFAGDYFFADLCAGWIRRFDPATPGVAPDFATGLSTPVDLAVGPEGDLYYAMRGSGGVIGRISTDAIFADGMETGDVSAWSGAAGGSDLAVTGAAALEGEQGLEANVNDTEALFVRDDTPNDENRYLLRFAFDPNGFDPGESAGQQRVRLFIAFEEAPRQRRVFAVVLRRVDGAYSIGVRSQLDAGAEADTPFVDITDEPHVIEVDWQRSGTGTPTGSLALRIDGVLRATLASLDNDVRAVDFVRLGVMNAKGAAAGTVYFDSFTSRREP